MPARVRRARARGRSSGTAGSVEKFIGDAVVGVFGVPAVHEDDPERAVRCALRLLEGVEGLCRPDGAPLQARAGIMTGELLVALDSDPAHGDGHVAGDAVNTAQRLEASAPPGAVVVGDLTHQLTRQVITYEGLPPWSAKGKTRPLVRWLARHTVARVGPTAAGRPALAAGRPRQRARLLRQPPAPRPRQRQAADALLLGDPGIGKSRLVRELYSLVDVGRRVRHLAPGALRCPTARSAPSGRCARSCRRTPGSSRRTTRRRPRSCWSAPWTTARTTAGSASACGRWSAWTRRRRTPRRTTPPGCGSSARSPRHRPLVIVIEDLHWADEALLAFIDYVAQHLTDGPLLLVGTGSSRGLRAAPGVRRVGRPGHAHLARPAVRRRDARLVWSLPEMEGTDAAAVALVASRAEGNPFFAEELARLLAGSAGEPGGPGGAAAVGAGGHRGAHRRADAARPRRRWRTER